MITEISINNYKSALKTRVPLSRFNVLIGENGAGKSNVLESLALASASGANKLDTEYLSARGVRLCTSRLTKSAFNSATQKKPIKITIKTDLPNGNKEGREYEFILHHDDKANTQWQLDLQSKVPLPLPMGETVKSWRKNNSDKTTKEATEELARLYELFKEYYNQTEAPKESKTTENSKKSKGLTITLRNPLVSSLITGLIQKSTFERFTVYNPNYETLKDHLATPSTSPIGSKGEGMLATIHAMQEDEPERFRDVTESLKLFDWYSSIRFPSKHQFRNDGLTTQIAIGDRHIRTRGLSLDDSAVNEGFLYVLFYLTVFCSSKTPEIFGIENIDTALNPRLCEVLIKQLIVLSKKYEKQVILTTHNPAILDGLNLDDDTQSLLIVRRNIDGHTLVDKYLKPRSDSQKNIRLSEAFLRGHIGALPKGI